jgi:serine protease inhibitor
MWIAIKPGTELKNVIQEIDPHRVFLVNALWFLMEFDHRSDTKKNVKRIFTAGRQKCMASSCNRKFICYYSNVCFAMAKCLRTGNYAMLVLLSQRGKNTVDILDILDSVNWTDWKTGCRRKN